MNIVLLPIQGATGNVTN